MQDRLPLPSLAQKNDQIGSRIGLKLTNISVYFFVCSKDDFSQLIFLDFHVAQALQAR